jgi:hypothetical protein
MSPPWGQLDDLKDQKRQTGAIGAVQVVRIATPKHKVEAMGGMRREGGLQVVAVTENRAHVCFLPVFTEEQVCSVAVGGIVRSQLTFQGPQPNH